MLQSTPASKFVLAVLTMLSAQSVAVGALAAAASSPKAKAAIAESISAALQGDALRARKALSAVTPADFSSEDARYRTCMIERFGQPSAPPVPDDEYDPFVRETLTIFQHYWHRALRNPSQRETASADLKRRLIALLAEDSAATSWEAIEKRISDRLRMEGYYSQLGYTPPLRELMIWRKQDSRIHDVALPEGSHQVRVEMLDDFVALGWSAYARCDRGSNGGWVGEDRLYAVAPAFKDEEDADAFNASLLGHETQHFADKKQFPGLEDWELEYRAKLTELWTARETLPKILRRLSGSQSDDKNSPHTYANKRVLMDLRARLETQGVRSSEPDLSDAPADELRAAARDVLLEDSRRRQVAHREKDSSHSQ